MKGKKAGEGIRGLEVIYLVEYNISLEGEFRAGCISPCLSIVGPSPETEACTWEETMGNEETVRRKERQWKGGQRQPKGGITLRYVDITSVALSSNGSRQPFWHLSPFTLFVSALSHSTHSFALL